MLSWAMQVTMRKTVLDTYVQKLGMPELRLGVCQYKEEQEQDSCKQCVVFHKNHLLSDFLFKE